MNEKEKALNDSIKIIEENTKNQNTKNMIKIIKEPEAKEIKIKKLSREYWKQYASNKQK